MWLDLFDLLFYNIFDSPTLQFTLIPCVLDTRKVEVLDCNSGVGDDIYVVTCQGVAIF